MNAFLAVIWALFLAREPQITTSHEHGVYLLKVANSYSDYLYSLEESWNLVHWEQALPTIPGSDGPITAVLYTEARPQRVYFRVVRTLRSGAELPVAAQVREGGDKWKIE